MPENTEKSLSNRDSGQTLQASFNEEDFSLSIGTFLQGVVGRKVLITDGGATEIINFSENGIPLYEYTLTYTDGTKNVLISAERTA